MSAIPSKNTDYGNLEYWNDRYQTEDTYEWFKCYADFRHIVRRAIKPEHRILMLGCGNSRLSEDMYADGYRNIVNVDYSPVVIEKMRKRCETSAPLMQWLVMDVTRHMDLRSWSFDAVIEKGTLDAMLVTEKDPWHITSETEQLMNNILSEVSRILKPDGRFMSITFCQPHFRRRLYAKQKYDWSCDHIEFGESFAYFVYLMTKGQSLSDEVLRAVTPMTSTPTLITTAEYEDAHFLNRINID